MNAAPTPPTPYTWKLTSPTAVLSWALVAFLLFLSARAALDPVGAADGFGLPLAGPDAVPWLRVKAGRDLGIALMLSVVLLQRQRRLVGAVALASIAMPTVDALTVIGHGARTVGYALGVHGSAVLYGLLLGAALLRPAKALRGRQRGPRRACGCARLGAQTDARTRRVTGNPFHIPRTRAVTTASGGPSGNERPGSASAPSLGPPRASPRAPARRRIARRPTERRRAQPPLPRVPPLRPLLRPPRSGARTS